MQTKLGLRLGQPDLLEMALTPSLTATSNEPNQAFLRLGYLGKRMLNAATAGYVATEGDQDDWSAFLWQNEAMTR
jgi:hypothetical protein